MRRNKQPIRKRPKSAHDGIEVPEGTPGWITPELIRETIATWQPFYPDSITPDEAVIILANVGRLFEVLSRG
jgi:hypothetical protein